MAVIVAPLVGAWIEILQILSDCLGNMSLPLWERGLKSFLRCSYGIFSVSLPLWERGLK